MGMAQASAVSISPTGSAARSLLVRSLLVHGPRGRKHHSPSAEEHTMGDKGGKKDKKKLKTQKAKKKSDKAKLLKEKQAKTKATE